MPGRPRRPRREKKADKPRHPNRTRAIVAIVIVVLIGLILSMRAFATFWTDYLWFDSLDLTGVWRKLLGRQGLTRCRHHRRVLPPPVGEPPRGRPSGPQVRPGGRLGGRDPRAVPGADLGSPTPRVLPGVARHRHHPGHQRVGPVAGLAVVPQRRLVRGRPIPSSAPTSASSSSSCRSCPRSSTGCSPSWS